MCAPDLFVKGEKYDNPFKEAYFFTLNLSFDNVEGNFHKMNYVLGLKNYIHVKRI